MKTERYQQVLSDAPDHILPGASVAMGPDGLVVWFPDGFWDGARRAEHLQALIATVDSATARFADRYDQEKART